MYKCYRKKPIVIEAIRWTGDNILDFSGWLKCLFSLSGKIMKINTLEGVMIASPGDYIIKGVKGEFYPCKPDVFEDTYEPE